MMLLLLLSMHAGELGRKRRECKGGHFGHCEVLDGRVKGWMGRLAGGDSWL